MAGRDTNSKVIGIDHVPDLITESVNSIRKHWASLLDSGQIEMRIADGRSGWP